MGGSESSDDDYPALHLALPVEHTHRPQRLKTPPRLNHNSKEFYDSVLRMEPSEEDDEPGNAFAFETALSAERYLV